MKTCITIDGPGGAGKTTAATKLAKLLDFRYINTGAVYRAIAVSIGRRCSLHGILDMLGHYLPTSQDAECILTSALKDTDIRLIYIDGVQHMLDRDKDITDMLKEPEMSMAASSLSAVPCVRTYANSIIRAAAEAESCIMEGRDTGTVVMPDAAVKFYLDANLLIRAYRIFLDRKAKGHAADPLETVQELHRRDTQDMDRVTAPLRCPEGAIRIDSSEMSAQDVAEQMRCMVCRAFSAEANKR